MARLEPLLQIIESGNLDENRITSALAAFKNIEPRMKNLRREELMEFANLGDIICSQSLLENNDFAEICQKNKTAALVVDLTGRVLQTFGDYRKCVQIREKAANFLIANDEIEYAANSFDYTSGVLHDIGEIQHAIELRLKAASLYEESGSPKTAAYSHSFAGRYFAELGKYEDAVRCKEVAYNLFLKCSKKKDYSKTEMSKLALKEARFAFDFAIANKDYKTAVDFLLKSADLLRFIHLRMEAAETFEKAADLLYMLGNNEECMKCLTDSLELFRTNPKRKNEIIETKIEYLKQKLTKPL